MRPPSVMQWLIGNPVVSFVFMLMGVGAVYFWLTGQLVGWVTLIAVFIAAAAAQASERVNAYAAWKREWEGMGGGAARSRIGKALRVLFAIATWALMAWWASKSPQGDPMLQAGTALFWLATAVLALALLLQLRERRSGKRRADIVVAVCLPAPSLSNGVRTAIGMLPSYCQSVLRSDG